MKPRYFQSEAIDALYAYFEENAGFPIVVLPTGSGKSAVIALFCQRALSEWPDTRVLVISHVAEILTQDFGAMMSVWPGAPAGIYSAGLGCRNINAQILFASIQSIYRRAYQLQSVDLVFIDEAHLVSSKSDTMYRTLLRELGEINPYMRVIGLTATPHRLDQGYLHKGPNALFDGIAYEASVRQLIDGGYLCSLITKSTDTQLDVAGVGTRGGEFIPGQLAAAVDKEAVTAAAVQEIVEHGADRRSWLVFCSGVDHAYHVAEEIRRHGISCETVTGETAAATRKECIDGFRAGRIRCLTNANVLTTGIDVPSIDLIAFLRPTKSVALYLQMAGRGLRLAPGKSECLVLDFARVVATHGPIDAVRVTDRTKAEEPGDAPVKACPQCQVYNLIAAQVCVECGYAFPPPAVKLEATASTAPILSTMAVQWVDVTGVDYERHTKLGSADSLRVTYRAGLSTFREWVCLEHTGFAREKACRWWIKRAPGMPVPSTISAALEISHVLAKPVEIAVRQTGKYHEIMGARFA